MFPTRSEKQLVIPWLSWGAVGFSCGHFVFVRACGMGSEFVAGFPFLTVSAYLPFIHTSNSPEQIRNLNPQFPNPTAGKRQYPKLRWVFLLLNFLSSAELSWLKLENSGHEA